MRPNRVLLALLGPWLLSASACSEATIIPARLRCESAGNPLGIDTARPRLSWILESTQRNQRQTAYQVQSASRPQLLLQDTPDLWDSGKVLSSESISIDYRGKQLSSGQRVYWRVRVWDRDARSSAYSQVSWWEMALLSPGDWEGTWISHDSELPERDQDFYGDHPAPIFRKEFQIGKPLKRARLYVSGLGYYEARLNGNRVGDRMLDPAWTTYSNRILYSTYDVTDQLVPGQNCLGAMLGNGWYNVLPMRMWGALNLRRFLTSGRPRLIAQLNLEFTDGTRQTVVTDESWKVSDGPVMRNSLYLGEVYDARKEQAGWDAAGFDDRIWGHSIPAGENLGRLAAQSQPPIRETARLKPVKLSHPGEGIAIFDMGQNMAGWVRLKVRGPAGTAVKLRFAELLHPDGTLNVMTTVCGQIKKPGMGGPGAPSVAEQSDTYILKGEALELYTPHFTYHGFRYVEVTGFPGEPALDAIEGVRLNTAVQEAGSFSCSNDLFNRIQVMARNTFPSNLMGVQTDCPARERFGYGDDIACAAETHLYNYDMASFYAKTVEDFADAARPNGALTLLAPWTGHAIGGFDPGGGNFADVEGGANAGTGAMSGIIAHPLLLDKLYQYYGDRRLLEEHYETARKSLEFIRSQADDPILTVGLGDWSSVAPTSQSLISTAFYYHHADIVARLAETLGRHDDMHNYTALRTQIKEAFIQRFLKPGTGQIDSHTQAAQAFALYYDLLPPGEKTAAIAVMVDDILIKHKGHLTTGIFGTKYLLEVLTSIGRADVAYTIVNQKTYPGWGFMLERGATTLWEDWNFSDSTYSHNHSMFGTVSGWFYSGLAGIQPAADAVGMDSILIRPQLVGDLSWVKASYDSIRGPIHSQWKRVGDRLEMTITVPVGTKALVHVPASDPGRVRESDSPIHHREDVRLVETHEGVVVYGVGSGTYRFTVE